jgi:hypothetical protein
MPLFKGLSGVKFKAHVLKFPIDPGPEKVAFMLYALISQIVQGQY